MPAVLIASGISSSWEEFSSITSNEAASPTSNPQKIEQWLFGDHHLTQPSRIEQSHHQLACSSSRSQSPFSYHVLRYPAPHSTCPLLAGHRKRKAELKALLSGKASLMMYPKLLELGFPMSSLSFQGALNALVWISLSEATAFQSLETHAARAKSGSGSFSRIARRVSWQSKAQKLEFIGEITASPP
nr:hypothetical protein Iba_chr10fCG3700 [Ipomoea batatas]